MTEQFKPAQVPEPDDSPHVANMTQENFITMSDDDLAMRSAALNDRLKNCDGLTLSQLEHIKKNMALVSFEILSRAFESGDAS